MQSKRSISLITSFVATISCATLDAASVPVELFHPQEITLLDGPFKRSLDLNEKYLLAHDPDRFLAPYLASAGLKPKAEKYGNWESSGLDGHSAGHYLSALAYAFAATGNIEYKTRLDYMLTEIQRCQTANGNGYVGGVPNGNAAWEKLSAGNIDVQRFSLNGAWVPWYNLHKTFVGLKDAWVVTDSDLAKDILLKLCDWGVVLTKDLSEEQLQQMLYAEHGGMNDVLAEVYQLTGKSEYLSLAKRFSHRELLDPLKVKQDTLTGLHANTQIPKAIGFQRISMADEEPTFGDAAKFFWENVVEKRSIVFGGNSVREHFHPTDDFMSMLESREGPESCNTHNMLRLTSLLYQESIDTKYIDYYERALFNHILSLQHPTTGGFVYFTPIRPRHYRVYSQPEKAFWCCVGSGMENPGRYSELIYAKNKKTLFVNLFIASQVHWKEAKITLTQETDFPFSDSSRLTIAATEPTEYEIAIRVPEWSEQAIQVSVNGEPESSVNVSNGYIRLERSWVDGDLIEIRSKMSIRQESLPDGSKFFAFLYGPIALAAKVDGGDLAGLHAGDGRMEHIAPGAYLPLDQAPIIIGDTANLASRIEVSNIAKLEFTLNADLRPSPANPPILEPFFQIHDSRYSLYWQVASETDYEGLLDALKQEERRKSELDSRTIDSIFPGQQQSEVEHDFSGGDSFTDTLLGKQFRATSEHFEYTLENTERNSEVAITYFGSEWGRACDVFINDLLVGEILGEAKFPEKFIDANFPIPQNLAEMVEGKIAIRIVAKNEQLSPSIFAIHYRIKSGDSQ